MTTPTHTAQPALPPEDERDALADSERAAARTHPENFKEAETDEKVVEIGPDLTDAPIEGLDPPA